MVSRASSLVNERDMISDHEDQQGTWAILLGNIRPAGMVDVSNENCGIAYFELRRDGFFVEGHAVRTPQMALGNNNRRPVFFGRLC